MGGQKPFGFAVDHAGADEENIYARINKLPTFNQALQLLVEEAMIRAKGNQSLAARLLGISQSGLNKRLKRIEMRTNSHSS
jgi:DNA-binding protein Fis